MWEKWGDVGEVEGVKIPCKNTSSVKLGFNRQTYDFLLNHAACHRISQPTTQMISKQVSTMLSATLAMYCEVSRLCYFIFIEIIRDSTQLLDVTPMSLANFYFTPSPQKHHLRDGPASRPTYVLATTVVGFLLDFFSG